MLHWFDPNYHINPVSWRVSHLRCCWFGSLHLRGIHELSWVHSKPVCAEGWCWHMKWSVKMKTPLESWQRLQRKDNMCSFLLGFPHCSHWLCSPWASRTTLYTPDKSTEAEKKISRHKSSLCNADKLHWFFFFFFDSQHKIAATCHVKLGLTDHIDSASIAQFFFGRGFVEGSWLWLIHLCEVPAFTQRHRTLNPEVVLCPTQCPTWFTSLYSWPQSSASTV